MKRTVRRSVFETNSSSTHSLTMVDKSEYDSWEKGDAILYEDSIILKESEEYKGLMETFKKDWEEEGKKHYDCDEDEECTLEEWIEFYTGTGDLGFYTYEQYFEMDNYETFAYSHSTKNGDKIVAFGYHGHD